MGIFPRPDNVPLNIVIVGQIQSTCETKWLIFHEERLLI